MQDGAAVDSQDYLGKNSLFHAARRDRTATLPLLGAGSLSRNLSDRRGRTALSYAAEEGHLNILQRLTSEDIEIDAHRDCSGQTPLSYASENDHLAIA